MVATGVNAMRKIFAVVLMAGLVGTAAIAADAGGRHGGGRHGGFHRGGFHHGGHHHGGFHHGGFHHGGHHHGGRAFVGFGFYGGFPAYGYPYYGYPYYYYPPGVVYSASPVVYTAPAPAAPPIQREVVYPHGKYVLEGDGVNTPYRWVWVATTTETSPPSAPSESR
jgi:hypothetical protein